MSRKDARDVVMKLLYQWSITKEYDIVYLKEMENELSLAARDMEYIHNVITGFAEHYKEIDEYIIKYSKGWSINRIPKVDLAIIRLAVYEILFVDEVPLSVSINEGVELAKKYSNEKAPPFINGILGSIARSLEEKNITGDPRE